MDDLKALLAAAGPGPVEDLEELIDVLLLAWPYLEGSHDEGMARHKLGRMEDPEWAPPLLTFRLERHGSLGLGGTRASMQTWTVDPESATATVAEKGYRQVRPREAPLRVEPLVAEIVQLITTNAPDDRLRWSADGRTVQIDVASMIPDVGFQETTRGRRKRLRERLEPALAARGWQPTGWWRYMRADQQDRPTSPAAGAKRDAGGH